MKIRFDVEIKAKEWLALACFLLIIFLIYTGQAELAVKTLMRWLDIIKKGDL
jgi:hypothetical protein